MKIEFLSVGLVVIRIIKFPFMALSRIVGVAVAILGVSILIPLLATIVTVVAMTLFGIRDVFNGGAVIPAVLYGAINIGLVGGVVAFGFTICVTITSAMIKVFSIIEIMSNYIERFLGRGVTYCQRMRVFK